MIHSVKRGCHDKTIKTPSALVSSSEMSHTQPRGSQEPKGFLLSGYCSPIDKAMHATRWLTRIGDRTDKPNRCVLALVRGLAQVMLNRDTAKAALPINCPSCALGRQDTEDDLSVENGGITPLTRLLY